MANFWDNVLNLFNTSFTQSNNTTDYQGGFGDAPFVPSSPAAAPAQPSAPSPWSTIGSSIVGAAAPMAAQLGTAAIADALFPGKTTKGQIVATDTRTQQGREAEALKLEEARRLAGLQERAQTDPNFLLRENPRMVEAEQQRLQGLDTVRAELAKGLADPFYGTLPADVQEAQMNDVKRKARNADAARGMLETGGSAERENEAIRRYREDRAAERNKTLDSRFSQLGQLSTGYEGTIDRAGAVTGFGQMRNNLLSGFTPESLTNIPGQSQPNPWAALTTAMVAPQAKKGAEALVRGYI